MVSHFKWRHSTRCSWKIPLTPVIGVHVNKGEAVTTWKLSKYRVISGPYFPVCGLNTEIYFVNLCIQSKDRKIRTRNNSIFGQFSRSACVLYMSHKIYWNRVSFSQSTSQIQQIRLHKLQIFQKSQETLTLHLTYQFMLS